MTSDLSLTFFVPNVFCCSIPANRLQRASPCLFGLVSEILLVLIVGPKLFIEPGTKAFFQLSSVSGPGL